MKTESQFTIHNIINILNLTLSNKSAGVSIAAGCSFFETEYKGIYLTDYNINWSYDMSINEANLFKSKNLLALVSNCKGSPITSMMISVCMFEDVEFIKSEIKRFAQLSGCL